MWIWSNEDKAAKYFFFDSKNSFRSCWTRMETRNSFKNCHISITWMVMNFLTSSHNFTSSFSLAQHIHFFNFTHMKRYSKSIPNASKSSDFMWVKMKIIRLLLDGKLTVNIHIFIFKRRKEKQSKVLFSSYFFSA